MLQELGTGCLSEELQTKLTDWLHYCLEKLAHYYGGIPQIDSFSVMLQQLRQCMEHDQIPS